MDGFKVNATEGIDSSGDILEIAISGLPQAMLHCASGVVSALVVSLEAGDIVF